MWQWKVHSINKHSTEGVKVVFISETNHCTLLFTIMIQESIGPVYRKTFKSQIQNEVQIFRFCTFNPFEKI